MKKVAILLVVATMACGATVCQYDQESMTRIDSEETESCAPELTQRLAAYHSFRDILECTLQSLERGEISLAGAASRVHDAAQTWPVYLADLEKTEIGQAPVERIARNIIGHLENRALLNPNLSHRLLALEAELSVLVSENENLP